MKGKQTRHMPFAPVYLDRPIFGLSNFYVVLRFYKYLAQVLMPEIRVFVWFSL